MELGSACEVERCCSKCYKSARQRRSLWEADHHAESAGTELIDDSDTLTAMLRWRLQKLVSTPPLFRPFRDPAGYRQAVDSAAGGLVSALLRAIGIERDDEGIASTKTIAVAVVVELLTHLSDG